MILRQLFILLFSTILTLNVFAQRDMTKHWVQFTDKNSTPFSLLKPQEFLSPAAIERRWKTGTPFNWEDLPVDPAYVDKIRETGAKVLYTSKWFNSVVIETDSENLKKIARLPFVQFTESTSFTRGARITFRNRNRTPDNQANYLQSENYHGYGHRQIALHNGHVLHQWGLLGDGVRIGVMDGGFTNVDTSPFFEFHRITGRLTGAWDFVDMDDDPYKSSNHGSQVISTMAAYVPHFMVGTAPYATYYPFRTEDTGSETRIEEDNWVAAMERADSLGIDVINTSLGYNNFDVKSQNYTYEDMNGTVSRASIAAGKAAERGFIAVISAGNAGNSRWKYLTAPADGFDILSVAGVNQEGNHVNYSSFGPSSDGRIKPNIAARGYMTTVTGNHGYDLEAAFGTSFASPIIAGLVATLVEAFPNASPYEIMDAVKMSGSLAAYPDDALGFGIADFLTAFRTLGGIKIYPKTDEVIAAMHKPGSPLALYIQVLKQNGLLTFFDAHGTKQGDLYFSSPNNDWLIIDESSLDFERKIHHISVTFQNGNQQSYRINR